MLKIKESVRSFIKMSYIKDEDVGSEHETSKYIDCSHGINPFGYSSKIMECKENIDMNKINHYPEFPYTDLRKDIVGYWADETVLECDNIMLGSGSMGVLATFNKVFIDEGTRILGYSPQFTDYISIARSLGGEYDYVSLKSENGLKFNYREIIDRMESGHSIVYIDNPNNPTGQIIPLEEIVEIAKRARELDICVVVDEAYGDFMDKRNSAVNIIMDYDNVFVTRTFSKGLGLAGIRIGYGVCSGEILKYYRKVDMPFSITSLAHDIARIALKDELFIKGSMEKVKTMKKRLIESMENLTVQQTDHEVPIMVVKHPDDSVDLQALFYRNGVLTESGKDFIGLGKHFVRLRIPAEIDGLIEAVGRMEAEIRKSA